jgi:hypothetical protein
MLARLTRPRTYTWRALVVTWVITVNVDLGFYAMKKWVDQEEKEESASSMRRWIQAHFANADAEYMGKRYEDLLDALKKQTRDNRDVNIICSRDVDRPTVAFPAKPLPVDAQSDRNKRGGKVVGK